VSLSQQGAPGYESGFLLDTLHYGVNQCIYIPAGDTSCAIYFVFAVKFVEIYVALSNPQGGCGFRPGVLEPAVFNKTSANIPVIEDLSGRG
jgi:hypothetical protein